MSRFLASSAWNNQRQWRVLATVLLTVQWRARVAASSARRPARWLLGCLFLSCALGCGVAALTFLADDPVVAADLLLTVDMGFVLLLMSSWDAGLLSRLDYEQLAPLPIRSSSWFLAGTVRTGCVVMASVLALAAAPGALSAWEDGLPSGVATVVASVCCGWATATGSLVLRSTRFGSFALARHATWLLAALLWGVALLLGGLLLNTAFPLVPVPLAVTQVVAGSAHLWFPPAWFSAYITAAMGPVTPTSVYGIGVSLLVSSLLTFAAIRRGHPLFHLRVVPSERTRKTAVGRAIERLRWGELRAIGILAHRHLCHDTTFRNAVLRSDAVSAAFVLPLLVFAASCLPSGVGSVLAVVYSTAVLVTLPVSVKQALEVSESYRAAEMLDSWPVAEDRLNRATLQAVAVACIPMALLIAVFQVVVSGDAAATVARLGIAMTTGAVFARAHDLRQPARPFSRPAATARSFRLVGYAAAAVAEAASGSVIAASGVVIAGFVVYRVLSHSECRVGPGE